MPVSRCQLANTSVILQDGDMVLDTVPLAHCGRRMTDDLRLGYPWTPEMDHGNLPYEAAALHVGSSLEAPLQLSAALRSCRKLWTIYYK